MTGPALSLALGLLVFVLLLRTTEPEAVVRKFWTLRLIWSVFVGLALWRLTPFWTRWDVVYDNPLLLFSINPGLSGLFGGLFAFAGTAAFSVWQGRKMRPGTRRRPLGLPFLGFAAVLVLGPATEVLLAPRPEPVPALAREILVPDLEGRSHALSDWRGRVLLVNFWSTRSSGSAAEIPEFRRFLDTEPSQVTVVGVNQTEGETDGLSGVLRFVSGQKMAWTQLTDPQGTLRGAFGVTSIPTTVVLGPEGQVLDRKVGPVDQAWLQQAGRRFGL